MEIPERTIGPTPLDFPLGIHPPGVLYSSPQMHRDRSATFCHGIGTADGWTHFSKMIKQASKKNPLNPDLNLEKDAIILV